MNRTAQAAGKLITAALITITATERTLAQQPSPTPESKSEPQVARRVVINIPAMTLELFENNILVRAYHVAVGKRSTPTPLGNFRIATQVNNPTWYGPRQVARPGPRNPVGTRWIGLDRKGYGIHGTNAPKSIGRAASHGCIRMRNSDVEELFTLVRVGDPVEIVYETLKGGTELADVYGLASAAKPAEQPASTSQVAVGGAGGS